MAELGEGLSGYLDVQDATLRAPRIEAVSNLAVGNTAPQHAFSVGSNLYVSTDSSNVLTVDGNVVCEGVKVGLIEIIPSYDFAAVSNVGNVTQSTIQFSNATTAFVTTANVEVGTANLFVDTVTGRVGIGKTDPGAALDVVGNAYVSSNLEVGTANLFVDTVSGSVGIGTNAPDGKIHTYVPNPTDFTGITHQSSDVKAVITNDNLSATNASMIQVYKNVTDRTPSTGDFHSETSFSGSNVYTLSLNPRGGRIGLNDLNPNSDLTMGARIYNTTGYVGLVGDDSDPIIYKGDPNNTTVTLPYTQYSTSNPSNGPAYYFINPYPGEAQCTVVYDNAQTSANGLMYFYQNGPNNQPNTYLAHSPLGLSEFTIPLPETGTLRGNRVNAVHMKPVNGTQIRIVAVYWVPYRGVTANIKDGGKLVLGTVGNFGTPGAGLTFRREYETPTDNQLEPKQRLDNGIAWMTDLSTSYNGALGGNGIDWSKNNDTYGVSVGARIWYQPGSFVSAGGGNGNCGSLYLSAGHNTSASNTPNIAIKSNGNVGIGTTDPIRSLHVNGTTWLGGVVNEGYYATTRALKVKKYAYAINTDTLSVSFELGDISRAGIIKVYFASGVSGEATVATTMYGVWGFTYTNNTFAGTTMQYGETNVGNGISFNVSNGNTLTVTGTMYSSFSYPAMEVEVYYAGGIYVNQ